MDFEASGAVAVDPVVVEGTAGVLGRGFAAAGAAQEIEAAGTETGTAGTAIGVD